MDEIKTGKYIISLIKALLKEETPHEIPDDIRFEDVYLMAKRHHILNMCLFAVEKLNKKPDGELMKEWDKQRIISSAQSAVQLREREHLMECFRKNQIKHLPLKGCLMKEMYQRADYREMADLDFLMPVDLHIFSLEHPQIIVVDRQRKGFCSVLFQFAPGIVHQHYHLLCVLFHQRLHRRFWHLPGPAVRREG